jgi:hypothetical protein
MENGIDNHHSWIMRRRIPDSDNENAEGSGESRILGPKM